DDRVRRESSREDELIARCHRRVRTAINEQIATARDSGAGCAAAGLHVFQRAARDRGYVGAGAGIDDMVGAGTESGIAGDAAVDLITAGADRIARGGAASDDVLDGGAADRSII